tara:strand:+ start:962 stop:1618 length:657 start_codon:yes stop_codon:yes gene_type:complete
MAFKMKAGKEGPMKKNFGSALNFNAGLRAASKAGKLDNNPKFKAAVDNAPMKKTTGRKPTLSRETTDGREPKMVSPDPREQRKIDSQYRRGKRQGHSTRTVNQRYEKGMYYQRKGPKLQAKKTTKLDVKDNAPMMRMDKGAMKKMGSPKKIDLNFSGGKEAKKNRDAQAKRDFLKNWKTLSDEQKRKVPSTVTEMYGVTKPKNPAKGQLGGLNENAQK